MKGGTVSIREVAVSDTVRVSTQGMAQNATLAGMTG
jgi:hypothetical protein